jgi:hypothetical protein
MKKIEGQGTPGKTEIQELRIFFSFLPSFGKAAS